MCVSLARALQFEHSIDHDIRVKRLLQPYRYLFFLRTTGAEQKLALATWMLTPAQHGRYLSDYSESRGLEYHT